MSVLSDLLSPHHSLVVTDTETTGVNAHVNRVIEIAAAKVLPDGTQEWFDQLIDPGVGIPSRITRITGISSSMVFGKPSAAVVLPSYREFLGEGIFVAHNIRFDWTFINAELDRLGQVEMNNPGLCTLRLARRLLPGLRSKSLGSLARFYRISGEGRHRARKDVEITVEVLERLAQIAVDEHGVSSLEELLQLQSRTYSKVNPAAKHVLRVRDEVLPSLPERPGVYHMVDLKGRILYVGKAKNLKQRVSSYFTAIEAHPPRLRQLISKMRHVHVRSTDTELHALIEESREIKELDPPFNRAQKKYIPRPYLRLGLDEPFPRLTSQVIVRDDHAAYFGPLKSRGQARTILEIVERSFPVRNCSSTEFARKKRCVRADIGRCGAPCVGEQSTHEYQDLIDQMVAFLEGDIATVCAGLEEEMEAASERFAFEEAAVLRDWISMLDERVTKHGAVAKPVLGPDCIFVTRPSTKHDSTVVLVQKGKICCIGRVGENQSLDAVLLAEHTAEASHDEVMNRIEIDARRILDHWLYANREGITALERRSDETYSAFVARSTSVFDSMRSNETQTPEQIDSYSSM